MKKIKYFTISLGVLMMIFSSCSDFLDTDSDNYREGDDNKLNTPNDSVYSLFGILANLQKTMDKHVIWEELQGDLMDVSFNSNQYLHEINAHNPISKDNPFLDLTDFYGVINNCNYVIARMDTMVGDKSLLPDYAAAVRVRAWTYFQMAKIFSTVRYYEDPILSVEDAQNVQKYPLISLETLLREKLLPQLIKVEHITDPLRSLNNVPIGKMIPSTEFLIAEAYLWLEEYNMAAIYYKRMMETEESNFVLDNQFRNSYSGNNIQISWSSIFSPNSGSANISNRYEVGAGVYYRTTSGVKNTLSRMCSDLEVVASAKAVDNWYAQENNESNSSVQIKALGDLRGVYGSWSLTYGRTDGNNELFKIPYITKFRRDSVFGSRIIIERAAMYHLRYAEAVNRLGKPTLALAALNYGLKKSIVGDSTVVNKNEVADPSFITDFSKVKYNSSLGVRGRAGLKIIKFPEGENALHTLNDSIIFVEDAILKEAALELGLEGNRWSDLVRFGLRRYTAKDGFPAQPDFVAAIMKAKFTANPASKVPSIPTADAEAVYNKLLDKNNFFIPFPVK